MKKIVFRVDSGHHIGMGHIMRCLTLAKELKKQNFEIHFIVKDHQKFVREPIEKEFQLHILSGGARKDLTAEERQDYKLWIGQTLTEDLEATNDVLNEIGAVDLMIIDHYSIDSTYEDKIFASKIMVIDDLMNRNHFCDLLLDQNITAKSKKYSELMSKPKTEFLMGPQFALLRDEFKILRSLVNDKNFLRPTQKILVFFGGADAESNTLKLAQSLDQDILAKLNFTFVLNSAHADFNELSEIMKPYPHNIILSFVEDFGKLMMDTDLFIGAGGTTSWERACLGVASALVAVAENQLGNCLELQKTNNVYFLGEARSLTRETWQSFFHKIVPDDSLWYRCRTNSFTLVDGLGVVRVTETIKRLIC